MKYSIVLKSSPAVSLNLLKVDNSFPIIAGAIGPKLWMSHLNFFFRRKRRETYSNGKERFVAYMDKILFRVSVTGVTPMSGVATINKD